MPPLANACLKVSCSAPVEEQVVAAPASSAWGAPLLRHPGHQPVMVDAAGGAQWLALLPACFAAGVHVACHLDTSQTQQQLCSLQCMTTSSCVWQPRESA